MPKARENYKRFQDQKQKLENLLEFASKIFNDLDIKAEEEKVKKLKQKISGESFKVMVLGRFNAGKSTFINALLGEEILPAYAIPCTAVINEVKYSEKKSALLFFKDPLPEKVPEEISAKAYQYLKEYNGQTPPPLEIPVNDLEEFVVIPKSNKEQRESVAETPYEKVVLYWPLDLCKDGVDMGDSPGLDEDSVRSRVTFNYLTTADAILFVMSCESLCSATEMNYIDNRIRSLGHEYIFFINNRINQIREKERKDVIEFGNTKLSSKTSFGQKGIFYVNALGALEGRLDNDQERVMKSGILPLEDLLSDFLANKKGKIKILQPSKEFISIIRKGLFEQIPWQRNLLESKYEDIKRRYDEQKPRLDNLEVKKKNIIEAAGLNIERAAMQISSEIEAYHFYVQENIGAWIQEVVVTKKFDALNPKKSSAPIIEEVLEELKKRMEAEQLKWISNTLTPLIESKTKSIFGESIESIRSFLANLDEVKSGLSGIKPGNDGLEDRSKAERITAGIISMLAGGIGSAVIGYQYGFSKEAIAAIAMQVGAFLALGWIGLLNPFTIIPVIVGGIVWAAIKGQEGLVNALKRKITEKIIDDMVKNNKKSTEKMVEEIRKEMRQQNVMIDASLEKELVSVKIQVDQILIEKQAEGDSSLRRKELLNSSEASLKQIDQDINDLIIALAEQN